MSNPTPQEISQAFDGTYAGNPDEVQAKASVNNLMFKECQAMAKYALSRGLPFDTGLLPILAEIRQKNIENLTAQEVVNLGNVHQALAKSIAPALPRSIFLLESYNAKHGNRAGGLLGSVPLIRQMMLVGILSLVLLLGMALMPQVNNDTIAKGIFDNSGWNLLPVLLFQLSAAAVGAAFYGLFRANAYVARGQFDNKFSASYWSRFVLGLIAGILLAELIPINVSAGTGASGADLSASDSAAISSKPLLALLGGFSADLVYSILSRLVETVKSLFTGDASAQAEAEKNIAVQQAGQDITKEKVQIAGQLVELQQDLNKGMSTEEMSQKIQALTSSMTGTAAKFSNTNSEQEAQPAQEEQPPTGAGAGEEDDPANKG